MEILILAKDYSPLNLIAAQRPSAWYTYFKSVGHQVTVITSTYPGHPQNGKDIIRVPTDLDSSVTFLGTIHRKIISYSELWLPFITPLASRYAPIYTAAEKHILQSRPDIIIATGEPFVLFGFARKLSRKYNIPWVADYRDPWSYNRLQYKGFSKQLSGRLQQITEKNWLKSAAFVTTAAPAYSVKIHEVIRHPEIHTILNGHSLSEPLIKTEVQTKFYIGYSGRIYAHQPIEDFMLAFDLFLEENNYNTDIQLHFFGLAEWPNQMKRVTNSTKSYNHIQFHKANSYIDYMKHVNGCQIKLLLSAKNKRWLNAKIFDYLVTDGEILLYPAMDGELDQILFENSVGIITNSIDEIKRTLSKAYSDFKQGIKCTNQIDFNKYSRQHSAKQLLDLIRTYTHVE